MIDHLTGPRIAILGLHLEANAFAPVALRDDFTAECWEIGDRITEQAYRPSHLPLEVMGFYQRMDFTGPWVPVPLIIASAQPSGPMDQEVFDEFMGVVEVGLREKAPIDAVYICSHGGSKTTRDSDNDGTIVTTTRKIVGPDVPIVVSHDLHCSVSERMVSAADALIAYKTNPHIDIRETAAKSADLIRRLLNGTKTKKAFVRLPIAAPGISLLTAQGPYGDLIKLGESFTKPPVLDVSVTGGFVLTDVAKGGMTVNVTTDNDQYTANKIAIKIATTAWNDRLRYLREARGLEEAVNIATDAANSVIPPIFIADISDNPGGGARGNTIWIMKALHDANVKNVVAGVFTDQQLAEDAADIGCGNRFQAIFNRVESEHAKRFEVSVKVRNVSEGRLVGRRGMLAGREILLGKSALLEIEGSGLQVIVSSIREQLADPAILEHFGVNISAAKCIVGKSRGHFRAGFDEFFSDQQIYEVDTPGLTSSVLANYDFKELPRPSWPLDNDTKWIPPTLEDVTVHGYE